MSINDIPVLSTLRTRMQWHQQRQRVLADNVANSDTPNFRPRDLVQPSANQTVGRASGSLALAKTDSGHLAFQAGDEKFQAERESGFDVRPAGNAVDLEEQMLKVAANQMDYQAAATLYSRSLGLLKTAIGKR